MFSTVGVCARATTPLEQAPSPLCREKNLLTRLGKEVLCCVEAAQSRTTVALYTFSEPGTTKYATSSRSPATNSEASSVV